MAGGRAPARPGARLLPAALAGGGRLRAVVRALRPLRRSRARTAGSTRRRAGCSAPTCRVPGSASPAAGDARRARRAAGRRLAGRRGRRPAPPQGGQRPGRGVPRLAPRARPALAGVRRALSVRRSRGVPSARRPRTRRGATPPTIPRDLVPRHVAIIMDGNGRWAKERGLPRTKGHEQGERSLFDVVEGAHRDRREGDLGLRLLHRELDPLARRGELPDGLQPRRDPPPPRRDARARRAGALGRAGPRGCGGR